MLDRGGGLRGGRVTLFLGSLLGLAACGGGGGHRAPTPDARTPVEVPDSSVKIQLAFDDCPELILAATPSVARIGGKISVSAVTPGRDGGAPLTYAWSATAGSFASATAASTIYTCPGLQQAGSQTLTVSVSDGKCKQSRTAIISCYAVATGPDASAGSGAGGGAGTSGGGGGVSGVGGSMGTGGMGGSCPNDDRLACEGTLCNQCTFGPGPGEADICSKSADGCYNCIVGSEGDGALKSDSDRQLCADLYVCLRDNKCVRGGDPSPCWCGTAKGGCADGSDPANGPCLRQVIAAAKSNDPGTINIRFIDPTYPVGCAVNLAACRSNFCGKNAANVTGAPSCPLW